MAFASGKNWGTAPDQSTFTSDVGSATRLATSGSFTRYLTEQIVENSAMIQAGLIATDARLNNVTGVLVELPFFDQLDYIEENIDSSATWGTITPGSGRLTTQKHTASTQYGTIVTRGAGFAADILHQYETGEDALANVSAQMTRKMNKDITSKIVSQLTGLFGGALSGNVLDVSVGAGGTAAGENYLNAQNVTAAKYLLGEKAADVSVIVVHPLVAADMEARGMLVFQNNGGTVEYASNAVGVTSTQIGYFGGLRVVVDSQVPVVTPAGGTTGDAMGYTCYLAAPGVIRTGSQFPLTIQKDQDILSFQDIMSVRYSRIDHVLGTSYGGTPHPENPDLADPANWSLAYSSRENVPLIQMIVNTPYGASVV
nr:phage capsid protein [uncultured Mediterranean phage uvMED]